MNLTQSDLHALLDSAPDATVVVDERGCIVFANSQVSAVFGYEPETLIGAQVETLLPERLRENHHIHQSTFVDAPVVRPMGSGLALFGRRRDGTEFPIEISLSPVRTEHGLLVSSAIRDVTERKVFELALQSAKDAAESATATKSRFLAAASHDLRQPLQSIGIYTDVLNRILRDNPDKALEVTSKLEKSLDVMSELLDALLDISKLDSGSIQPEKCDFPLQNLFEQLLADNAPSAEGKGLTLSVVPTEEIVYTDPSLLQRILENFVTNAIRYTEQGTISVRSTNTGDQVQIEVRDTGVGIPEESIDTIFEEYFQIGQSRAGSTKGFRAWLVHRQAHLTTTGQSAECDFCCG